MSRVKDSATHFIEVYKNEDGVHNEIPERIGGIERILKNTKDWGWKTIAIWYIKPKQNDNN